MTNDMSGSKRARSWWKGCAVVATLLAGAALPDGNLRTALAQSRAAMVAVAGLSFAEGTIFVGQDLYFVDYARSDVMRLVGAVPKVVWHQDGCGANGLVEVPGGLLVACFDSGTLIEISLGGATLGTIRQDARGQPFAAPNDFAFDRRGGIYISDSGSSGRPGKVFHLGQDRVVREVASGIRFANGIGVSPDRSTLYVAESPTGKVLAFPIRADGTLGPARDLVRLRDVVPAIAGIDVTPDSLRVDRHGNLFVALYSGGGVAIVSPAGKLLELLEVPSQHHTTLAISPDEETLYVTAIDDDPRSTYRGQIVRLPNPLANLQR